MTQIAQRSSIRALWRTKTPGLSEFEAILNVIPQASLLYDMTQRVILAANSAFFKLSAYSQGEVVGSPLDVFIQDVRALNLSNGNEGYLWVNRHRREPLQVRYKVNPVDSSSQWFVLTLDEDYVLQQKLLKDRQQMFALLLDLLKPSEIGLDYSQVIVKLHEVIGVNYLCIYRADNQFPQLLKAADLETTEVFPEKISSSDLLRLSTPSIWMPGRRVFTDIHKAARIANLSYVATAPIGQEGALFGLLVVGDNTKLLQEKNFLELIGFLGKVLATTTQYNLLVDNLRMENERQNEMQVVSESLVDNLREGVVVLNSDLTVKKINPAAELLLGYADWEVWNLSADNILIGADGLTPALELACQGIPTLNLGNVSIHRRDGQAIPVHIQTLPVQKNDTVSAVLVILSDVSEHEQIRVRTQQLEHRAMLGDITAIFAHEVRNPINNISMGTQVLSTRLSPDDPNQDIVQRILGDCTRLDHLMESVLASSRPMESSFKPMSINTLLHRIIDRWQPRFNRVNIKIYFQTLDDLPFVNGDMRSLEQVFTNLISNAVEAMSKTGGTLAIRAQPSDAVPNRPSIEVTISDNGPGIPDEVRDRLFDPFVSTTPRGTGLGLAITKRIVTAHQGTIRVSTFPGGTVFHVLLPIANGD